MVIAQDPVVESNHTSTVINTTTTTTTTAAKANEEGEDDNNKNKITGKMIQCASPNCTVLLDTAAASTSLSSSLTLLACPKCLQLGLPPSYFCGQDCFRNNYSTHKQIHTTIKKKPSTKMNMILSNGVACYEHADRTIKESLPIWAHPPSVYNFSGQLRPCLYSPQRTVTKATVKCPDYAIHPDGISESEQWDRRYGNHVIRTYGEQELLSSHPQPQRTDTDDTKENDTGIYGLRHACRMGREVLDVASAALTVGITTDEIDRIVFDACMERDCYPSPLNYYNFPKSLCTSVNEVICHGIPDYREVCDGDIVNLDISVYNRGGYHSDLNETFMMGKQVDADSQRLVRTSFECLALAIDMVRPGALYRDLGTVIEKHAKLHQCSVVRTYCGHGIGSLFHTTPNVPHYAKNKAKGIMKVGHVFTIEPMINLGSYPDKTWDDNWTAVTCDGKRSSQFEHTILVTETGYELLTARANEPVMTWDPKLNTRY